MKVVVLTDIHFSVSPPDNGIDPVERLTKALAHIHKYNSDAQRIIITGDLTDKGDIPSYELLKNTLKDTVQLPLVLMVGNHDNRENFLSVFPETQINKDGHVQHVIDEGNNRLIMLDTLDGPPYNYPLSHRGMLCEKRLHWLDEQLASAGSKACTIFMHHHPHDAGFKAMDTIKLVNGEEFYEVIERHNNVRHISCGHIHRTISGSHRGIPFSVFKSTVGQMPMIFDSMDFHAETNEPASYGMIDFKDDGIIVHTEDYELTDLDQFI